MGLQTGEHTNGLLLEEVPNLVLRRGETQLSQKHGLQVVGRNRNYGILGRIDLLLGPVPVTNLHPLLLDGIAVCIDRIGHRLSSELAFLL